MNAIRTDPPRDNAELRRAIYQGAIFRLPPTPASAECVRAVLDVLQEIVGTAHPLREAQHRLSAEVFFDLLGRVRTVLRGERFLDLARGVMAAHGFEPAEHAVDVLRLRAVLHGGHHNPAAAPAYSAHRDTWYANPRAQVNWWIPLHDVGEAETFVFYPGLFAGPVANTSAGFDHGEWTRTVGWQSRRPAGAEAYPTVTEDLAGRARLGFACRAGEVVLFSAAHLHQTAPNESGRTRFSLDFRTVHLGDHARGLGAPDADNHSRGSALGEYVHPRTRGRSP